jgi:hypothetical protein
VAHAEGGGGKEEWAGLRELGCLSSILSLFLLLYPTNSNNST